MARISDLDALQIDAERRAAIGLQKASQYGIDRYPTIVLDGRSVVHGVTDVGEALRQYRVWQGAAPR